MNKNSFFSKINNQNGQALLIVVLVMVVALTVGLSIASKSITSFRNSTEQASSQKALSAAEAGIEQILKSNITSDTIGVSKDISQNATDKTTYKTDVTIIKGKTFLLNGGNPVVQSSGIDLWLTAYSSISAELYQSPYSSDFSVYWGSASDVCDRDSTKNTMAALEVVVIGGTRTSPIISKYAFDPCPDSIRTGGNHFNSPASAGGAEVAGKAFSYRATIPGAGGLIARVVPLYASTIMGVIGLQDFPSQGKAITTVGSSGTTERRVNVFQGYPELPAEYYLYNLFVP